MTPISTSALLWSSIAGSVLQVMMVVGGHYKDDLKKFFAVGGMGLSLVAGVAYVLLASRTNSIADSSLSSLAAGGCLAGAACALVGIFVSWRLGDVPASLMALGTVSSAATGAIGGVLGRYVA